ncbi:hypothetical protein [Streptosporangium sp. KLBMP 9127]|nr:hypothetical protein [Streptosporangium sp. KLBMP 9127]
MGISPCKRGPNWLAGCVLLAVQTSIIALVSTGAQTAHAHAAGYPPTGPTITRTYVTMLSAARQSLQGAADVVPRPRPKQAMRARLGHGQAMRRLRSAGLRWRSSGDCTNRKLRWCTSLTAVRRGTVASIIELKRRSGCPIVVTGGTEAGHSPGVYSHAAGYKLDITLNACVDRFITGHYPLYEVRGDGARMYRSPDGDLYAREHDHWDILFR